MSGTYGFTVSAGTVQGSVSGSTVALTLTDSLTAHSNCVQANLTPSEMTGPYMPGCGSVTANGSFDVTRQ